MKKTLSIIFTFLLVVFSFAGCKGGNKEKVVVKPKKAYILAQKGDTYSLGLATNFQKTFENMGGSVFMETFMKGTTDFSEYLENAVNKNAGLIFAPTSSDTAPNILSDAEEVGIKCPILSGDAWNTSSVIKALKDTKLNVYSVGFFDEENTNDSVAKKFVKGFKEYTKDSKSDFISELSVLGYDAYNVALKAIRDVASKKGTQFTSADVANALSVMNYNKAVSGKIVFDRNGDAKTESGIIYKLSEKGTQYFKIQDFSNSAQSGIEIDYSDYNGVALDTVNKKIIIGVFEPITGQYAEYGNQELLGIKYANSLDNKVKIGDEEYSVELFISDNASSKETAFSSASTIVSQKAMLVLGSYNQSLLSNSLEVFKSASIPTITVFNEGMSLTEGNEWCYRMLMRDYEGTIMANFGFELLIK